MPKTITAKELAVELDANPRQVRKFLRSPEGMNALVGKGHRWAIEARQVRSLKTKFSKWVAAQKPANSDEATEEVTEDNSTDES